MAGKFDGMKADSAKAFLAGERLATAPGLSDAVTCVTDLGACVAGVKNGKAFRDEIRTTNEQVAAFEKTHKPGDTGSVAGGPAELSHVAAKYLASEAESKTQTSQTKLKPQAPGR